jgi:hypothetical protein
MSDIGTQLRQQLQHLQNRVEPPSYDLVNASISRYRHHRRRLQRGAILTAAFLVVVVVSVLSTAVALSNRGPRSCEARSGITHVHHGPYKIIPAAMRINEDPSGSGCSRR